MLPAPEFFQTTPTQQNSTTSRPSSLRNLRLPLLPRVRHPLPERLQRLRKEKKKPSDKELIMNTTLAALVVFGCFVAAVLSGRILRRLLPETAKNLTSHTRHACHHSCRGSRVGCSVPLCMALKSYSQIRAGTTGLRLFRSPFSERTK
jgi:hypothetical protein